MAATALAQRQARSAATATRRRQRPARGRGLRAVRTATAITDAADSRLIVRLTRSQAWIAIIGALLIGIVALNVYRLGMSATVSTTAQQAATLERENSLLRERIGKLRKNGEIERSAAKLGLGQPTSEQLVRVSARPGDIAKAAARLKGEISAAATTAAIAAAPPVIAPDPVAEIPAGTEQGTADPAAATATQAAPPAEVPAAPAEATTATAGGVAP